MSSLFSHIFQTRVRSNGQARFLAHGVDLPADDGTGMRGKREGVLAKKALVERLDTVQQGVTKTSDRLPVLLGHAIHHGLVSRKEVDETTPRNDLTIPCYLHSHVVDPAMRAAFESYVLAASALYRRGSHIANLMAMRAFGVSWPGPTRPRFEEHYMNDEARHLMAMMFMTEDVRSTPIKQIFLPERWPSKKANLHPSIQSLVTQEREVLAAAPTNWRAIMRPSGWDNVINRMATKYFGNIQVHAKAGIVQATEAYIQSAPLKPGTSLEALLSVFRGPLRPTTHVHQEDWEMAIRLRASVGLEDDDPLWYLRPKFSEALCKLHFFLVRHGSKARSYLPVVTRGRKYCYLDAKAYLQLRRQAERSAKAALKNAAGSADPSVQPPMAMNPALEQEEDDDGDDCDGEEDTSTSLSIGDLMGLTPAAFNRTRARLRRQIVKEHKRRWRDRASPSVKRKRARQLAQRWQRLGIGRMDEGARVDSIETDGVGLRLCVKSPIDMTPYILPLPAERKASTMKLKRHCPKKPKQSAAACVAEDEMVVRSKRNAIHVGLDEGRAKLYTAAISRDGCRKPTALAFTRHRCRYERLDVLREKWENGRMEANPAVRTAIDKLSNAGGLRNCFLDTWRNFLRVDLENSAVLDAEFLDQGRALWSMLKFRKRKASLDRAASRLVSAATSGEPMSRPLVMSIGDAKFSPTGRGEISVPTAALHRALSRALDRERSKGREVVVQMVDEFRTTKCCCACGAVTAAPQVRARRNRGGAETYRQSCRLRQCTECEPAGRRRDRDVQAARNILWIGVAQYLGLDRPEYLCRPSRRMPDAHLANLVTC